MCMCTLVKLRTVSTCIVNYFDCCSFLFLIFVSNFPFGITFFAVSEFKFEGKIVSLIDRSIEEKNERIRYFAPFKCIDLYSFFYLQFK